MNKTIIPVIQNVTVTNIITQKSVRDGCKRFC